MSFNNRQLEVLRELRKNKGVDAFDRLKLAAGQAPPEDGEEDDAEGVDWWRIDQILLKTYGLRPWEIERLTITQILMYLEPIRAIDAQLSPLEEAYNKRRQCIVAATARDQEPSVADRTAMG
jgi:hypothetical protein